MEKVRIDDVDSYMGPADVKRPLTKALGAADVALNYYELAPGDSFAFGYHAHEDQEEVFYVQSGTVTFETADDPVAVGPGEAVRFAPGEFQRGVNEGDRRVVALAIGAPRDAGETEVRRHCEDCGERTPNDIEMTDDREALVTRCVECGAVTGRFT
jgi:uncharacterized cupin superfamily protein